MNTINHVILCILDDVKSSDFFYFIRSGLLPNFKKLMEKGIWSDICITDFPAITFPSHVSIITGTYTGNYRKEPCHGVPLFNWMERTGGKPFIRNYAARNLQIYKVNEDLGKNCRTLFEMINEGNKSSIAQFISRGTDYFFPENKVKLILYYLILRQSIQMRKMAIRVNSIVVQKLLDTFKNPHHYFPSKEPPIASLLWFMTPDIFMHFHGYDSEAYKLNLKHIDACMGVLCEELDKMGYLDDTAIALLSDHGNYKAKKIGDLTPFLRENGLKIYNPPYNPRGNVNIAEFDGIGFFYFKAKGSDKSSEKTWEPPTIKELENYGPKKINLLHELLRIPGASFLIYRDDNNTIDKGTLHVLKKDAKTGKIHASRIEYQGKGKTLKTKYIVGNEEQDPLEYSFHENASKYVNNHYHDINGWINFSATFNYPLYPDLLSRYFKNPRSGDIILSTDGTRIYNLKRGKRKNNAYLYSHDLGIKESALVPLIISGSPEIPKKYIKFCKITDVVPTLLKALGKQPHKSVIGNSLF